MKLSWPLYVDRRISFLISKSLILLRLGDLQINLPREERRDANKLYNPMSIKELSQKVPEIPWLAYMNTILAPHHVLTENERVIVDVPDYFPKLVDLLANTPRRSDFLQIFFLISFSD